MSEIRGMRELPEGYHEVHDEHPETWSLPGGLNSSYVAAGIAAGAVLFAAGILLGSSRARSAVSRAGDEIADFGGRAYGAVRGSADSALEAIEDAVGLGERPSRPAPRRRKASTSTADKPKTRRSPRAPKSEAAAAGTTRRRTSRSRKAEEQPADADVLH